MSSDTMKRQRDSAASVTVHTSPTPVRSTCLRWTGVGLSPAESTITRTREIALVSSHLSITFATAARQSLSDQQANKLHGPSYRVNLALQALFVQYSPGARISSVCTSEGGVRCAHTVHCASSRCEHMMWGLTGTATITAWVSRPARAAKTHPPCQT